MPKVTLAEQMGAIALVDELRHRQMLVQEHLDLAERRREVARRIREFYASQNMVVDDALVEQGVLEYFSRRLVFEAPRLGPVTAFLAHLYINRRDFVLHFCVAIATVIAAGYGVYRLQASQDAASTARVQAAADEGRARVAEIRQRLLRMSREVDALPGRLPPARLPSANRMLEKLQGQLASASAIILKPFPSVVTAESRDKDQAFVKQQLADLEKASAILTQSDADLRALNSLLKTYYAFEHLARQINNKDFWNRYPALQEAEDQARQALEMVETRGVDPAESAVHRLGAIFDSATRANRIEQKRESLGGSLRGMDLGPENLRQLEVLEAAIVVARQALDVPKAQKLLGFLDDLHSFARIPLKLAITENSNGQFAVERTDPVSGKRAWYLLVQAHDSQGATVAIPNPTEEKPGDTVIYFGVMISRAEHEQFNALRERTGSLRDTVVGQKPYRSMVFEFKGQMGKKPQIIFEM